MAAWRARQDGEEEQLEAGEYEVHEVVDSRTRGGQVQYMVTWKGGEQTWEPAGNLEGCKERVRVDSVDSVDFGHRRDTQSTLHSTV